MFLPRLVNRDKILPRSFRNLIIKKGDSVSDNLNLVSVVLVCLPCKDFFF